VLQVVAAAGCSAKADTLACLRSLPYSDYLNAANSVPGLLSYTSIALSYLPRPDGTVLTDSPDALIASGKYAKVPFIVGDQEDEGTLFALFTSNVSSIADLSNYLNDVFFPATPKTVIDALIATYGTISEDGSPFRTFLFNNWYPQFKRIAAILGDLTFTLTRRVFLDVASKVNPGVKSWSYLASYDYGTPVMGTFHASDLIQVFYGIKDNNAARSIRGYYYSFIYDLDPNSNNNLADWPEWKTKKQLMQFGSDSNNLLADDFRKDSYEFIKSNVEVFRI
jgi:carboxylesterase type B